MHMSTVDDATAKMKQNLQDKTGKSFAAWINIARSLGTAKHSDIVAYLKDAGPMGHGYANMIALESRKSDVVAEEDPIDALFAGGKVQLRPIYDAITKTISTFGRDIEFAPKKNYVSVRRAKQFALLQPSTADRLDIGINLKGVAPEGKLEASGTWNGMVSHRVRIQSIDDFDKEVKLWLKRAYDQAG
jgi:predicted transport protein